MAKSNIDKLMELKQLYEQGILTKEELETEKKKILGTTPETPKPESPKTIEEQPSDEVKGAADKSPVDTGASFFIRFKGYIIGGIALLLVIVGIMFVLRITSQPDMVAVPNDNIKETKSLALKGVINGKIGFTMHLSINEDKIEGTEHYDNQRAEVNLVIKGMNNGNGRMILSEYDGNSKAGTFEGTIGENTYSGTFTNSKGKAFPFSANIMTESTLSKIEKESVSKNQSEDDEFAFDAWSGKTMIYGGIYRNCQTLCVFDLEKSEKGMYVGEINLLLGGEDDMGRFSSSNGMLEGKVRGKKDGNSITIVLDEYTIEDPYGAIAYGELKSGQQIFRLTYENGNYSAKPVGKMEYFFDGVTDETRIYKK